MKKSMFIRSLVPLAVGALLQPTAVSAQTTSFTATGWVNQVLVPGIVATNALGQIIALGNIHTHLMQSPDPRVAGQTFLITDGSFNADRTMNIQGPAYLRVGAWDAAGTNFTPGGALWATTFRGVIGTDFSKQITFAGYGVGGTIDGWGIEGTVTVGPASSRFDKTVPYLYAGTIKPPPVTTTVGLPWTQWSSEAGNTWTVQSSQLTVGGNWPGVHTVSAYDAMAWGANYQGWVVHSGQTLEARVDLVSLNPAATSACLALYHAHPGGQGYIFEKAADWMAIIKSQNSSLALTTLWAERVTTKSTNVVLVLALTPVGQNVILTAKVLDKDSGAVLYQKSTVDTPAADPYLTAAELAQITGGTVLSGFVPDPAAAPWTSGNSALLAVFQDTDGKKPAAQATFANFELWTYEVPQLSIAQAVQLTWPSPAGVNWVVEGAPTPKGPYLPIQESVLPGMQSLVVPINSPAEFFRLVEAP